MALLVGAKLESVSVVPHRDSKGRTIADAPTAFGGVMTAAAGSVAECIAFGFDDNGTSRDLMLVQDMLGGVLWEEYQAAARWMLEMHWASVERVAAALETRYLMSGDDVRALFPEHSPLRPNVFERPKRVA